MVNRSGVRTIVGIIGNVISFGLFASPAPAIWRIFKNKDVEEFKPDPYIATVMNCMFWVLYGLPFIHPDSTLVVTINAIGLAIELIYLSVFLRYGQTKHRVKIGAFVVAELAAVLIVGGLVTRFAHTHALRSRVVGIICDVFGIVMYMSPLTIMKTVITTKSVEFMPFYLSLTCFLNGICWVIYALLRFDLFLLIPNGIGAVFGLLQLILYACYYKTTPKKGANEKKSSEVELETV